MDVQQEGNLEPRCPKRGHGQTSAGCPKRERDIFNFLCARGCMGLFGNDPGCLSSLEAILLLNFFTKDNLLGQLE